MPLDTREVHVWYQTTSPADEAAIARRLAVLSPRERERSARFVQPQDRIDYVFAHGLLRETLSRYAEVAPSAWQFETAASGKPRVAGAHRSALSFSLSHTRGLVACAVGQGCQVGVDVESHGHRASAAIEQLALASSERLALAECDPADQAQWLLELWTLKEAYLKATGEGLRVAPDRVAFERRSGGITLVSAPPPEQPSWRFALFTPVPAYSLAVAAGGMLVPAPSIQLRPAL